MVFKLTDGERLIVTMLGDIYKNLNVKNPEIDPDFVIRAIGGGHDWAIKQRYRGLFPTEPDTEDDLRETYEILDMFRVLQGSYEKLSNADKNLVDAAVPPFTGKDLYFQGFDGNRDNHCSIATFLVEELELYGEQKGRAMDAHSPVIEMYRRMHETYETFLGNIGGTGLSSSQLIEVLKSRVHPSKR